MNDDYLQDLVNIAVERTSIINLEIFLLGYDWMEYKSIEGKADMKASSTHSLPPEAYKAVEEDFDALETILQKMYQIKRSVLLPELFRQIEEASEAADMENLTPAPTMMDVEYAKYVSNAVISQDADFRREVIEVDYGELIVKLVQVISMLKFGEELKEINQG